MNLVARSVQVTTSGVIDPTDPTFGWNHNDKGGVLQIWECPGEMLVADAFSDEAFVHKVLFETKDNAEAIDDVKFSPDGRSNYPHVHACDRFLPRSVCRLLSRSRRLDLHTQM
jgi:hypothetical protein